MKIKITITMDEHQANWFLSALESLMDGWLEEEGSEKYSFFRRIRKTIERHLTPRAADEATGCAHRAPRVAGVGLFICDDCGKTLRR